MEALSAVLLLIIVILTVWYFSRGGASGGGNGSSDKKTESQSATIKPIPGYSKPSNEENGNAAEIAAAGSMPEFLLDLHKKHGPIVQFYHQKTRVLSLASPGLFKQVVHLFDRPGIFFESAIPLIGESSIQFRNGEDGQQARKMQDRSFSHAKLVERLSLFQEIGEEQMKEWAELADKKEHMPLSMYSNTLALTGITRYSFGDFFENKETLDVFARDYDKVFWYMENYLLEKPMEPGSEEEKSFNEGLTRLKGYVSDLVAHRQKQEVDPEDHIFIDNLLEQYDNEDMLFSDAVTYLLAGSHTTRFYLVWFIYNMALHPDIQEKCYNEICEHYKGGPITYEIMIKMKYMLQCLKETHRTTPVGLFAARYCDHDMTLDGYHVPANTPMLLTIVGTLWNEQVWPDSHTFNPDRFSDESKVPAYGLEPFGIGKRKCPGYRMTDYEAQVYFILIFKQFKVSIAEGQEAVGKRFGLIMKPDKEIYVSLERRE